MRSTPLPTPYCHCCHRHTVPQFEVKKQCFITFDSDHLVVPNTGNYTIYYAPNTSEGL